jgi:hypothetical protein
MGRQEVAAAISLFDANPDILICLAASISNAPPRRAQCRPVPNLGLYRSDQLGGGITGGLKRLHQASIGQPNRV